MAASNQYRRVRPAAHPAETLQLKGTLQQQVDLLRQALAQREQQLAAQKLRQEAKRDLGGTPYLQGWSRTVDYQQGNVTYRRTFPNGEPAWARYDSDSDSWEIGCQHGAKHPGGDTLQTSIWNVTHWVWSFSSNLLGRSPTVRQLGELAASPYAPVRARVARSSRCTPGLLAQLSTDLNKEVRLNVAANRRAPSATLQGMLRDPDNNVARAAAANPGCPRHLRAMYQLAR
jgi:hypothetical protein